MRDAEREELNEFENDVALRTIIKIRQHVEIEAPKLIYDACLSRYQYSSVAQILNFEGIDLLPCYKTVQKYSYFQDFVSEDLSNRTFELIGYESH